MSSIEDFLTPQAAAAPPTGYELPDPEEAARANGCAIVYPADNELQLDIDSEADFTRFEDQLPILKRTVGVTTWRVHPSKSGGEKRHVTVVLDRDVTDARERILLQALLGSDRKRELLSLVYLNAGRAKPTLFFEKAVST